MAKSKNKEDDFSDFYNVDIDQNEDFYGVNQNNDFDTKNRKVRLKDSTEEKKNNNGFIKRIIAFIIFLLLAFLIFFVIHKANIFGQISDKTPTIKLLTNEIKIDVGDSAAISYEILNTTDSIKTTFTSSNNSVATVNDVGVVEGIGEGNAVITIAYRVGFSKYEKKCNVTVNAKQETPVTPPTPTNPATPNNNEIPTPITPTPTKPDNPKTPPTLTLSFEKGKENAWTNENAVIKVTAKSNTNSSLKLKYTVNCNNNGCTYQDVKNNQITISEEGGSVVSVVATDGYNNRTTKSVTVKIDKTAPKVTLNPNNITTTSSTDFTMCAICQDATSRCKKDKVCQTFSSSAYNKILVVEDNAGNKAESNAFNVVINKVSLTCSLSVTESGVVSATYTGSPTYYGFDSSYSGTNATSKQLKASETVNYYIKDSSGAKATCSISVVGSCGCKFRANDGKCYTTISGRCNNDKTKDKCSGGENCWWSSGDNVCYRVINEGQSCTFKKK